MFWSEAAEPGTGKESSHEYTTNADVSPADGGIDGVLNVSIGSTGAGQVKLYRLPDSGAETLVAASPIVTCS